MSTLVLMAALASAAEPAEPAETEPPKTRLTASGVYTAWGLHQNNFVFGRPEFPLDDGRYAVQMLRLQGELDRGAFGVVARLDAAQGWWGVDNSPNVSPTYNADGLFGSKDTNYAIHVDLAYAHGTFGPLELRVGRQPYTAGHLLVLDEELDGVVAIWRPGKSTDLRLSWAKVAEGMAANVTPTGAVMSDEGTNADVDLVGLTLRQAAGPPTARQHLEVFGWWYHDAIASSEGSTFAHLPQGLGYAESRFSPQPAELVVGGIAGRGGKDGSWAWKAEADVLWGTDPVDNADHLGGAVDRNDGTLFGYNAYLEATKMVDLGVPFDASLIGGLGSGDPDVTGGAGNVNKISTQGFFSLLNVWEDSVMPDIAGISPQGLGSPVSRGYRELENTTIGMVRLGAKPVKQLRLEVAGAYLLATEPVPAWDATGTPTDATASDLGWEVDANAGWSFTDAVSLKALFGWFQPGTAALYLINGTDAWDDPAWELKSELALKF